MREVIPGFPNRVVFYRDLITIWKKFIDAHRNIPPAQLIFTLVINQRTCVTCRFDGLTRIGI